MFRTAESLRFEWMSEWSSGGQGQVYLGQSRPDTRGEWILYMRIPAACLLESIQFWDICTVESLTNASNGLFVFEQVVKRKMCVCS